MKQFVCICTIFNSVCYFQIYDLSKMKLKYLEACFNSPEVQPTCNRIDRSFGATKPAQFDERHHMFVLSFLGITFLFPVDHPYEV